MRKTENVSSTTTKMKIRTMGMMMTEVDQDNNLLMSSIIKTLMKTMMRIVKMRTKGADNEYNEVR